MTIATESITRELDRIMAMVREDSGDAPCSRYGTRADSWAPWVVASFYAHASANGWPEDERASLDEHASRVVNDSPEPAQDVYDRWAHIPRAVRVLVGSKVDARRLMRDY